MLLVMFMLGAVLGNIVVLCMQAASAEFAEKFGMVVSYPVMFIPRSEERRVGKEC